MTTVQLCGPTAGEVHGRDQARDPAHDDHALAQLETVPAILGHEGAGIVVDVGPA